MNDQKEKRLLLLSKAPWRDSSIRRTMLLVGVLEMLSGASLVASNSLQDVDQIEFERGGLTYVSSAGVIEGRGIVYVGNNGVGTFDGESWKQQKKYGPDELMQYGWSRLETVADEGWAVSESCAILKLTAKTEEYTKINRECKLNDVVISKQRAIWIAGSVEKSDATTKSMLMTKKSNDDRWIDIDDVPGRKVYAIYILDEKTLLISTKFDTEEYRIYITNNSGGEWEELLTTRYPILDFSMDRSGELWAVGGGIGRLNNSSHRLIFVMRDGIFKEISNESSEVLRAVYFDSSNTGWAVGEWGVICKFDRNGQIWIEVFRSNIGQYGLNSIVEYGDRLWFLGDTQFIYLSDNKFSYWGGEGRPWGTDGIMSISIPDDDTGWAAGWWGPVLHRKNGIWKERYDIPHSLNVSRIVALSDENVWVAYNIPGVIAHFDGKTWNEIEVPSLLPIIDIEVTDGDDVWLLVGTSQLQSPAERESMILELSRGAWSVRYRGPGILLYDIDIYESDIWTVGDVVLSWNGVQFEQMSIPGSIMKDTPVACAITGERSGWIASRSSVYLLRDGIPVLIGSIPENSGRSLSKIAAEDNEISWVAGSAGLFRVTTTGMRLIDLNAARPSQIAMSDVVIRKGDGVVTVWAVGRLETIVRLVMPLGNNKTDTPIPATIVPTQAVQTQTPTTTPKKKIYQPVVWGGGR